MDFTIVNNEQVRTVIAKKASETVIEAGDLVGITSGLIVKAGAETTALAYAPYGAGNGETEVEVTIGSDFILEGTADENFAVTHKGTEVDVAIDDGTQLIDIDSSTYDVLLVDVSQDAGTVDAKTGVRVKINKPIF